MSGHRGRTTVVMPSLPHTEPQSDSNTTSISTRKENVSLLRPVQDNAAPLERCAPVAEWRARACGVGACDSLDGSTYGKSQQHECSLDVLTRSHGHTTDDQGHNERNAACSAAHKIEDGHGAKQGRRTRPPRDVEEEEQDIRQRSRAYLTAGAAKLSWEPAIYIV